jgi:flagellar basal body rod protein FlgG
VTATGVSSDVALSDGGFLTVQTPAGVAYTRVGQLHVSPTGTLTTAAGDAVLSTAGTPIHLDGTQPWTIAPNGVITQAGRAPQTLAVHTLTEPLTDLGNGVYQGTAGAWHGTVTSGALTGSNVSLNDTMTALVQAQSAYSANADVFNADSTVLAQTATLAQPAGAPS